MCNRCQAGFIYRTKKRNRLQSRGRRERVREAEKALNTRSTAQHFHAGCRFIAYLLFFSIKLQAHDISTADMSRVVVKRMSKSDLKNYFYMIEKCMH